jgi:hypothetical protein
VSAELGIQPHNLRQIKARFLGRSMVQELRFNHAS